MYEPSSLYTRTDAERKSQVLSWARTDRAFFAAGACHILAYTFLDLHKDDGFELIGLVTSQGYASHVYTSDGTWAFDFNGWTPEAELLSVTETTSKAIRPSWSFERIVIQDDMETFCKNHFHRPPSYFLHLPWQRAHDYIAQFENYPPRDHRP